MIPFPFVRRSLLEATERDAARWQQEAKRQHERAEQLDRHLANEYRIHTARIAELQARVEEKTSDTERYDRLYADYSRLVQQVVSLKRRGYEMAPEHKKPRAMLPEPEEVGLRRAEERELKAAEEEFIDRAAKDLVKQGFDVVAAEREARRLLAEATDAHPAGG